MLTRYELSHLGSKGLNHFYILICRNAHCCQARTKPWHPIHYLLRFPSWENGSKVTGMLAQLQQ